MWGNDQMKKRNRTARFGLDMIALLCLLAPCLQPANAQDYPSRPIRIISPVPAGGLSDVALRPVAQELSKSLGQTVIVDNRPGAGGTLAGRACAQASADGYTICNFFNDVVSNAPFLFKNLAYDPYRDFAPITNGYFITAAFLVAPSLNVGSLAELIALSKSRPEGLNYASPSTGATMFIENFNQHTGARLQTIPYKSGGEVANALLTNSVQVAVAGIGTLVPHLQAGTFKALAVDSAERSPLLPDVPTFREVGYEAIRIKTWYGFFAPVGTPPAIVKKLHEHIVRAYDDPALRQRALINAGLEPATNTPEEFTRFLQEDRERTANQVKRAGIQPQ
jgi:tripartite-type tricarboxylate transporter receptor subunit TctC